MKLIFWLGFLIVLSLPIVASVSDVQSDKKDPVPTDRSDKITRNPGSSGSPSISSSAGSSCFHWVCGLYSECTDGRQLGVCVRPPDCGTGFATKSHNRSCPVNVTDTSFKNTRHKEIPDWEMQSYFASVIQ